MLLALVLGHRRLWVFGSFYTDMIADRDRWRDIALRGLRVAEKGASVAETLVATNGK